MRPTSLQARVACVAVTAAFISACSGGTHNYVVPATPETVQQSTIASNAKGTRNVRYRLVDVGTLGGPNGGVPEAFLAVDGVTAVPSVSAQGAAIANDDTSVADPLQFFDDGFFPNAIVYRDGNLTRLPALPGSLTSSANSLSKNGTVAGSSQNGQTDPLTGLPELRAVIWRGGSVVNLGTKDGYNSAAFAVNDKGVAAGYTTNTTPDAFLGFQQRPARFDHGIVQDLPTLGDAPDAIALLINERGQIAGIAVPSARTIMNNPCANGGPSPPWKPFLWDNGKLISIGNFGGDCGMVNAMNDRGEVVGQSYQAGDATGRAFLWQSGVLRDLGTLGGSNASAEAIDDAGDIVGFADLPGGGCSGLSCIHHGFLLRNGVIHDLRPLAGDPCSRALAVNNKGQAVGASVPVCGGADVHALLWDNGGPPIDLNTVIALGADLSLFIALAINDRGIISGNGMLPNGDVHGFVLVPCTRNCAEVKLGSASSFDSGGTLTETMQNVQRSRVFGWHRNRMTPTLKD